MDVGAAIESNLEKGPNATGPANPDITGESGVAKSSTPDKGGITAWQGAIIGASITLLLLLVLGCLGWCTWRRRLAAFKSRFSEDNGKKRDSLDLGKEVLEMTPSGTTSGFTTEPGTAQPPDLTLVVDKGTNVTDSPDWGDRNARNPSGTESVPPDRTRQRSETGFPDPSEVPVLSKPILQIDGRSLYEIGDRSCHKSRSTRSSRPASSHT
jgi:hypothetical protein